MLISRILIIKYCFVELVVFFLLSVPVFSAIRTETSMKVVKNTIEVQTVFINESKENFYVLLNNWMISYDVRYIFRFARDSYNSNFLHFIEKTWTFEKNSTYAGCLYFTPMSERDPVFFKVPARSKRKLVTIIKFDPTLNMVSAFQNMKGLVKYSYVNEAVFLTSKEIFKKIILYDKKECIFDLFEDNFLKKDNIVKSDYFQPVFYKQNHDKVYDPIPIIVFQKIVKYSTQPEIVPIILK